MNSPLSYYGGKAYLAREIIDLFPAHKHYVETCAGGLWVLFKKEFKNYDGVSEIVNDINGEVTNFWRVLQHPAKFAEFKRLCEATPFDEVEWKQTQVLVDIEKFPIKAAHYFFVRHKQSLMSAGKSFRPLTRKRTRRGMNEQVSQWLGSVEGLQDAHNRIKRIAILNRPLKDVILSEDSKDTLFYLDPPYLDSTRQTPTVYANEMSHQDHKEMLDLLTHISGKFLLSGYHSQLYDDWANQNQFFVTETKIGNSASTSSSKRIMTECVWRNF